MNRNIQFDMNGMSVILSKLEENVDKASTRISDISEENKEVKTFEEVKKSSLAKVYGNTVDVYYEICSMLTEASTTLMDMRTLKKQVSQMKGVPSIEQQFRARIDRLVLDLEELKTAIQYMKDAYDAKLRFYNSCQYMMNGASFTDRS